MNKSRKNVARLLLASVLLAFAGSICRNTLTGVGRDVEKVGNQLEKAAR